MTDGQVCCGCIVVHPDGDDELNVGLAAADWRCWRRAYSCQQGSAAPCYLDTGGLSGRAWTWHDLPHRASASRRVEDVTDQYDNFHSAIVTYSTPQPHDFKTPYSYCARRLQGGMMLQWIVLIIESLAPVLLSVLVSRHGLCITSDRLLNRPTLKLNCFKVPFGAIDWRNLPSQSSRNTQWTIKKRDTLFLTITLAKLNGFL